MLLDLRGQGGRRDRLLLTCQAAVPALVIVLTTVSCSRPAPDMPPPRVGFFDELFPPRITEPPRRQLVQRDQAPPKARPEQPRTSASPKAVSAPPKVAKVQPANATSRSGSPSASKKANTPPRSNVERE